MKSVMKDENSHTEPKYISGFNFETRRGALIPTRASTKTTCSIVSEITLCVYKHILSLYPRQV